MASQYLAKAGKIETAVDAVFAHDLKELAQADRDRVATYAAAKVPGLAKAKGDKKMPGDFIVCDDYRKGLGAIPALIMGAVATGGLSLGGFGLWMAMQHLADPPPSVTGTDTDTQYVLELVPTTDK